MKVPEEIRKVERPKRTVIVPYRSGTYAVRARFDEYDQNGNVIVKAQSIIGYISEGKYRPSKKTERLESIGTIDYKQFGGVYLCNILCSPILDDLCKYYDFKDAEWIYCVAMLRACYPGIRDCKLKSRYMHTFVSEFHKGVTLNKDHNTKMFTLLGEQFRTSERFMAEKVLKLKEDDLVIIDGCLKQDNGTDIPIAKVSRKTAATKVCHHLMMYAYSSELKEPICSKIYPGNVVDSVAVQDFINSLEIHKGLIIADRGFRTEIMGRITKDEPELHYVVPVMKNRQVIYDSKALRFDTVLNRDSGSISCKKVEAVDKNQNPLGFWLYAFNDPAMAAQMQTDYLDANKGKLDPTKFEEEKQWFGTIVLQSDIELEPNRIYDVYDERWGIECLFKMHKSAMGKDSTEEKSEETVTGSEFVNFVATLMASKIRNHLAGFKSCEKMSYRSAISDLNDCGKVRKNNGEWEYSLTSAKDMKLYVEVGVVTEENLVKKYGKSVSPAIAGEPKKRGRPKGSKDSKPRVRRNRAELGKTSIQ